MSLSLLVVHGLLLLQSTGCRAHRLQESSILGSRAQAQESLLLGSRAQAQESLLLGSRVQAQESLLGSRTQAQ